jgi:succinate-semialdehyde dehydrogenase / glutarate-semialdehyde dehydrogenase
LKTFEPLTPAQIEEKLQRAAAAFAKFRKTSYAERASLFVKAADILENEKETFGRMMTLEMGKTFKSAIEEAQKCAWVSRYYAEHGAQFLADEVVETGAKRSFVRYQPLGAVLAVMPWNYPFWQVIRASTPALMAGNVMLLKHASNVPQCALMIEDLYRRAGFPEGVFQTLLIGSGQVDAVLNDPRVVAATLTGSEGAGVEVGMGAAKRVKKVVLELGGSDPFIVMPSANMDEAVSSAVKARITNNGQSCINAKRFIVSAAIADEFERRFVETMQALRVGDPFDEKTDVGPLATKSGLHDIEEGVRKTVNAGGRVLTGGKKLDGKGFFYAPTVMVNAPENSPGYCEEFFGPVANLFRAKDIDDAIRIANDTRFGLGASIWTNDDRERERFISDIESGMLFVNKIVASDPRLPFGGVKWSGYGRELGVHGIREFTDIKTVWIQ